MSLRGKNLVESDHKVFVCVGGYFQLNEETSSILRAFRKIFKTSTVRNETFRILLAFITVKAKCLKRSNYLHLREEKKTDAKKYVSFSSFYICMSLYLRRLKIKCWLSYIVLGNLRNDY